MSIIAQFETSSKGRCIIQENHTQKTACVARKPSKLGVARRIYLHGQRSCALYTFHIQVMQQSFG